MRDAFELLTFFSAINTGEFQILTFEIFNVNDVASFEQPGPIDSYGKQR